LLKLCHINYSGPVFFETQCMFLSIAATNGHNNMVRCAALASGEWHQVATTHCLQHLTVAPLTIRDEARYWQKIAIFSYPIRRSIAITFRVRKLEWCGYPMVQKIENMFIRFDRIHERGRRTDGHRTTA